MSEQEKKETTGGPRPEEKLLADRRAHMDAVKAKGIDPWGGRHDGTASIGPIVAAYEEGREVSVAGRITGRRQFGKANFLDLRDWTGKIQLYVKKDIVGDAAMELFNLLDLGDLIGVKGKLFKTKTGETTVEVMEFRVLTKSLRPLPEKWHGLQNVEIRYRQRYLDLISNPEVMETFRKRSLIVSEWRRWLSERGFIEVETPMMQPIPGGAAAKPFTTHHNALDMQLYMRIAPELYLKRLLVGGMEKVFEINRNFRNEGISPRHNPEFTMCELYWAYSDYNGMMELTEGLLMHLSRLTSTTGRVPFDGREFDFTPPWPRKKYLDLFQEKAGFDWFDHEKVVAKARELKLEVGKRPHEAIANDVWEHLVEADLSGPVFVIDFPVELSPLTKRSAADNRVVERFELYIANMEIANAYTELNDPIEQRERFERQITAKEEGMERIDEDFLVAQEHGMPPAGGIGIGVDRVVMLLTDSKSIRDVILFPLMRNLE
ncbi:MAG: lysyl-tRNA synthetase class [Planctomycetota bacterium]|nr:MAG: lysyl-tRNA synthetase class [Planctomycetota bacterium]